MMGPIRKRLLILLLAGTILSGLAYGVTSTQESMAATRVEATTATQNLVHAERITTKYNKIAYYKGYRASPSHHARYWKGWEKHREYPYWGEHAKKFKISVNLTGVKPTTDAEITMNLTGTGYIFRRNIYCHGTITVNGIPNEYTKEFGAPNQAVNLTYSGLDVFNFDYPKGWFYARTKEPLKSLENDVSTNVTALSLRSWNYTEVTEGDITSHYRYSVSLYLRDAGNVTRINGNGWEMSIDETGDLALSISEYKPWKRGWTYKPHYTWRYFDHLSICIKDIWWTGEGAIEIIG